MLASPQQVLQHPVDTSQYLPPVAISSLRLMIGPVLLVSPAQDMTLLTSISEDHGTKSRGSFYTSPSATWNMMNLFLERKKASESHFPCQLEKWAIYKSLQVLSYQKCNPERGNHKIWSESTSFEWRKVILKLAYSEFLKGAGAGKLDFFSCA